MIKGIGCDIVQNDRVNLKIARKILTQKELEIFESKSNKLEYLASRFAAKEAVIKATNKKYSFKEIEITNNEFGQPICNILEIMISISHEKNYSIAYAIWED